MNWTPWQSLGHSIGFSERALAETLNGGQAFRWRFVQDGDYWEGIWDRYLVRIRLSDKGTLLASYPKGFEASEELQFYLGSHVDWTSMLDQLPYRSDAHLAQCLSAFPGLRLLQQPFAETLLCFLCSATKQIPQIKVMCSNLAERHGSEILPGVKALPSWEQLAMASEDSLRELNLGFRAKNIKRTADTLAGQPTLLSEIERADYEDAKRLLMDLPGVGEKIADCALLFGAGKWQAFPVDTWIIKVLENRYQLSGWSNPQLAQFGRIHFGPYAGFAQQFLFSWERSRKA